MCKDAEHLYIFKTGLITYTLHNEATIMFAKGEFLSLCVLIAKRFKLGSLLEIDVADVFFKWGWVYQTPTDDKQMPEPLREHWPGHMTLPSTCNSQM